jgi:HlyD family secretion protein
MNTLTRVRTLSADPLDFAPGILKLQQAPPSPLPRYVLWTLLALVAVALAWSTIGRLDIIAVAPGRLVPASYLQIVQPAEPGVVRELLVREGDTVKAGQVLARMDMRASDADRSQIENEIAVTALRLRRIDAELAGGALARKAGDRAELFAQVDAQFRARRQAYLDAVETERSTLTRAEQERASAREVEAKLEKVLPIYREQEAAFDKLTRDGYSGRLMYLEKQRERIEKEQELKAQQFAMAALTATIEQANRRIAQIGSTYRRELQDERVQAEALAVRLEQERRKQSVRHELMELRAPQDGIVKDFATHTVGSVLSPGTVLMTLVPVGGGMQAEVWVTHDDVGFVRESQAAQVKLAAYPFQKYGMLEGQVKRVSPDASDASGDQRAERRAGDAAGSGYRTLVTIDTPYLQSADGRRHTLQPGMQITAEIHLGTRTVLEYLLSPVQRAVHEAARER